MNQKIVRVKKITGGRSFEASELSDLAASIKEFGGLLNPIVLVQTGTESYKIVARFKELAAVKTLGETRCNALVFDDIQTAIRACQLTGIDMPVKPKDSKWALDGYMEKMLGLQPA